MFDDFLTLARAIHVLTVVIWIGGVYFVTFVVLPSSAERENPLESFEQVENRFARQAQVVVTLAGLSGFYMLYAMDGWDRYLSLEYWWIHAMTALWAVFTFVLFVAEPIFLHAWLHRKAQADPQGTMAIVSRFHKVLTALSFLTIAGTIFGVHG